MRSPRVGVVIATFNRVELLARLLESLAHQTVSAEDVEVVVVDDGSHEPVEAVLSTRTVPHGLKVIRQANGGPAAARDRAIRASRAPLIVIVDDDMMIGSGFLEAHLAAHASGEPLVVLGRIRTASESRLPLFERFLVAHLDRLARETAAGRAIPGGAVYSGNVSLRRADYLSVGGFDPTLRLSEDAELGIRLERAGVRIALDESAESLHGSDHTSLLGWLRRSEAYGMADARVSAKHPDLAGANPWRFLFEVHRVSRPLLLASALFPGVMGWCVVPLMAVASAVDRLGGEALALRGATLAYGIQYFRGVRRDAASVRGALRGLWRYLNAADVRSLRPIARVGKFCAAVVADHDVVRSAAERYGSAPGRGAGSLVGDLFQKIGFQMMVSYRVMRLLRDLGVPLLPRLASRLMRHLYSADIHWDAELAPGVLIVHGMGLVISHAARVGGGCVLFQRVTLGESIHPLTRRVGAPVLESDVHVGAGATLLGPIVVGRGSKIAAGAVVADSVPPDHLVEQPPAIVRPRRVGAAPAQGPETGEPRDPG